MSEDARDPIAEQAAPQVEPQVAAAQGAPGVSKEDMEITNMVKDQIAGVLRGADCILVPVTTIVNGRIFQAIEVMRRPKESKIQPVKGGIIKP